MELKFRAWEKDMKVMFPDETICRDINGRFYIWIEPGMTSDKIELMRSTGLKDKNGKEIYEGDIVKRVDIEHGPIGKVVFEKGCFVAIINQAGQTPYRRNVCDENARFEVIGNIWENPNLLKSYEQTNKV